MALASSPYRSSLISALLAAIDMHRQLRGSNPRHLLLSPSEMAELGEELGFRATLVPTDFRGIPIKVSVEPRYEDLRRVLAREPRDIHRRGKQGD